MSTVFSNPATQWPLLQRITEQKFKSGLFNVSAEFVCPVGIGARPAQIETSIGLVDVWPEPAVSTGTDGFERINATGYGVWDNGISEITYGYELGELDITYTIIDKCTMLNGCDGEPCGNILKITPVALKAPVFFETVRISKIGDTIPASPNLKVFYLNGIELPNVININSYDLNTTAARYDGLFQAAVNSGQRLVNIKKNVFGQIKETEVVYRPFAYVDFGSFTQKTNCTP
jgi:hypothetical protein